MAESCTNNHPDVYDWVIETLRAEHDRVKKTGPVGDRFQVVS
jgi:hypothetical protein